MTHAELLDRYIGARLSVISEFSGDMMADWRVLLAEVETYAAEHDLALTDKSVSRLRERLHDYDDES